MGEFVQNFKNMNWLEEIKLDCGGKKILIDYCGPNLGKKMHLSHLRTTIIGESIKRLLNFCGNQCVGDIHYGDIGTQMACLFIGIKNILIERNYDPNLTTFDIESFFDRQKQIALESKKSEVINHQILEEALNIQNSKYDQDKFRKDIVKKILLYIDNIYLKPLNISFENFYGESRYISRLKNVIEIFSKNTAYIEGNLIIPLSNDLGTLCLKTKDELITYAGIDMSAIYDRLYNQNIDQIIYVIDERQERHWKQVFYAWKKIGTNQKFTHLSHGKILDKNGNPYKLDPYFGFTLDNFLMKIKEKVIQILEIHFEGSDPQNNIEITSTLYNLIIKFSDFQQFPSNAYVFDIESDFFFHHHFSVYIFKMYLILKQKIFIQKNKNLNIQNKNTMFDALEITLNSYPIKIRRAVRLLSLDPLIEHLKTLTTLWEKNLKIIAKEKFDFDLAEISLLQYEEIFKILAIPIPTNISDVEIKIKND